MWCADGMPSDEVHLVEGITVRQQRSGTGQAEFQYRRTLMPPKLADQPNEKLIFKLGVIALDSRKPALHTHNCRRKITFNEVSVSLG